MKKLITITSVLATVGLMTSSTQANHLLGIDVSDYQGSINWSTCKASGVQWAYVKAVEGYDFSEQGNYGSNMTHGKSAGLKMGAYQFSHLYANTPSQEAGYFWSYASPDIKADGDSLEPMIDFERFSGHDGTSTYTAWFNDWNADIKGKSSIIKKCVIYASAGTGMCDLIQYNLSGGIALSGWIADYNLCGNTIYTGNPWCVDDCCNPYVTNCGTGGWTYWQCSSTAVIGGINGCDLDGYNGTSQSALMSAEGL
jgi:GH25 family lysozyme M1 (1,4-beta-N-acetylmuramidase)